MRHLYFLFSLLALMVAFLAVLGGFCLILDHFFNGSHHWVLCAGSFALAGVSWVASERLSDLDVRQMVAA